MRSAIRNLSIAIFIFAVPLPTYSDAQRTTSSTVQDSEQKTAPKSPLLGDLPTGLVFIVSAPAGTGKTTLVEMLMKEFPNQIVANISYTTRQPRKGEVSGVHYHFISEKEFEDKISQGDFLEYVNLHGNYYGTSRQKVNEQQKQGKNVILVIDTQGGLKLKGKFDAKYIFIQPPSPALEVLKNRLIARNTEKPEIIEKRLSIAEREIKDGQQYDYQVINDDLTNAYQVLRSIVIAETHRIQNF